MAEMILTAQIDDLDLLIWKSFRQNPFERGRNFREIRPGARDRTLPGRHGKERVILGRGGAHGQSLDGGKERLLGVLTGQVGVMRWREESADDIEAVFGLQHISSAVEHRDVPKMNGVERAGAQ
jgi:hypothetical protein